MKSFKSLFLVVCSLVATTVVAEVVVLTDDNFELLTQASTGQTTGKWFVNFYASYCGHCKNLAPKWQELEASLDDDSGILIAKLDAVANPETKQRFGVTGFPTLLYIADGSMYKYKGPRTVDDMKEFVLGGYKTKEATAVPPLPSFVTQQRKKFLKYVEDNQHLKHLTEDFSHILNLRKNAAVCLIAMGAVVGMLIGYLVGSIRGSKSPAKQKSD